MDLFGVGGGCTVDAGVMNTGQHEHLVVRFFAEITELAYVHFNVNNKY